MNSRVKQDMRIGELAQQSGISIDTLRYYDRQGLLTPRRNPDNGYREYGLDSLQQLQLIRLGQSLGFSLEELAEMVPLLGNAPMSQPVVREKLVAKLEDIDQRIRELQQLRHDLAELLRTGLGPCARQGDNPVS